MSELDEYRARIDALDAQLVDLFLRRMAVTQKVGEYKLKKGLPVLDAGREREVLAKKEALVSDPALRGDVKRLYEAIMAISRRQQHRLLRASRPEEPGGAWWHSGALRAPLARPRVVYQGERGCYSDSAAAGFWGEGVDARGLPWFGDVFEALERGQADYAMLPIENSSTGSIRQVYDLLAGYEFTLVGEWQVKVDHCLCAPKGVGLSDIRTVYSHEQGLMQCDRFLDAHPDWTRVPVLDTAGAARRVCQEGGPAAAICPARAARLYGLEILAQGINHNSANFTRFVAVSPVPELRPGRDKVSALLTLPHQSGSLHEVLTVFAVHGLNLQKLESRPIPDRGWEYRFFLEFTGDLLAPGMDAVLQELGELATDLRVLGNFRAYSGEGER